MTGNESSRVRHKPMYYEFSPSVISKMSCVLSRVPKLDHEKVTDHKGVITFSWGDKSRHLLTIDRTPVPK